MVKLRREKQQAGGHKEKCKFDSAKSETQTSDD